MTEAEDRDARIRIITLLHQYAHDSGALPGEDVIAWFKARNDASVYAEYMLGEI